MAIPRESLDLVKGFEGYLRPLRDGTGRVKPYLCPARVATIGYGTTFYEDRRKVRMSDAPITHARALDLLAFEIGKVCEPGVDRKLKVALHALSRGSCVSFAFNCGTGAFARSTLLKRINERRWRDVPREFAKWRMGGGRVLRGLVRRRAAEAEMFMRGVSLLESGEEPATTHVTPTQITPPIPTRKPGKTLWQRVKGWFW